MTEDEVKLDLKDASISYIALIVYDHWKPVWYGAKPYLESMTSLQTLDDMFLNDSAADIVARFLVNASQWRGPVARQVKAELKKRLQERRKRR